MAADTKVVARLGICRCLLGGQALPPRTLSAPADTGTHTHMQYAWPTPQKQGWPPMEAKQVTFADSLGQRLGWDPGQAHIQASKQDRVRMVKNGRH
jgi:hypothetical protein